MTHTTTPNHLDLAAQLPAGAYYYLMHKLHEMLPELLTNSPEDIALRDQAAMAKVAALSPANIAEAEVAALHVAHAEHAEACYRDSKNPTISLMGVLKCHAQAASLSRQVDSSMRTLLRMQTARQKIEANPEARDRAAWTEHCTLNLMAEALSQPPASETIAEPPSPPPSPEPQPEPEARSPSPCGRIEPRSGSMEEGAVPVTHHAPNHAAPVFPQTDAPIRPVERFAHLPDDDLIKALFTALKPASIAEHDQPAEAAAA